MTFGGKGLRSSFLTLSLPAGVSVQFTSPLYAHTVCPKMSPTVLFVTDLLDNSFNTLTGQDNQTDVLHTTFFYIIATNFKSPVPVITALIPSLYECQFCTGSNCSTALSSLPTFFPQTASLVAERSGNLRQQNVG
jgi:hypothetical protein